MYDLRTHNGTITIHNPETGGHRTFKISTARNGGLKGRRIIALLAGPNNCADFRGFGFVNDNGTISVWRRKDTKVFRQLARIISSPEYFTALEYLFAGACRVCNRRLTTPKSINSGIGPVCAGRNE